MPTKPLKKFTAWSYSRLSDYEKCPLMARLKHLDKIKEPDNKYQARGTQLHTDCGLVVLGKTTIDKLCAKEPHPIANFTEEFAELHKVRKTVMLEKDLAVDSKWGATNWFDSDAAKKGLGVPWCRVRVDMIRPVTQKRVKVRVFKSVDFKSGKIRDEHKDQLELYALATFAQPEFDAGVVESELWYLDQGEIVDERYERKDAPKLQKKWEQRVIPMMTDTGFAPKRNDACKFCHYRKNNAKEGGGQCPLPAGSERR